LIAGFLLIGLSVEKVQGRGTRFRGQRAEGTGRGSQQALMQVVGIVSAQPGGWSRRTGLKSLDGATAPDGKRPAVLPQKAQAHLTRAARRPLEQRGIRVGDHKHQVLSSTRPCGAAHASTLEKQNALAAEIEVRAARDVSNVSCRAGG
jgi:hypothetical protein